MAVDLKAVQERTDAATEGPWTARGLNDEWPVVSAAGMIAAVTHYTGNGLRNALFIAAARTDVPALVAELRAAREVIDAYREYVPGSMPKVDARLADYDQVTGEVSGL